MLQQRNVWLCDLCSVQVDNTNSRKPDGWSNIGVRGSEGNVHYHACVKCTTEVRDLLRKKVDKLARINAAIENHFQCTQAMLENGEITIEEVQSLGKEDDLFGGV